ncbi:hypothetical protein [uncultured Clostridium sp.]|uniref:hypothetical protein n=1 Tax=uncultured Clostridium sp. TaxID=59620 RepID=UPI002587746F|nr:hypothetical protein [uncultured Clostridium sp.]MDU1348271.1 hypothetical protein [Clostridium argentinense]
MVKKEINNGVKFTKEQIVNSNKFTQIERDILKALLADESYSLEGAKKVLEDFKKKEVK